MRVGVTVGVYVGSVGTDGARVGIFVGALVGLKEGEVGLPVG